jgi:hypothetical protein
MCRRVFPYGNTGVDSAKEEDFGKLEETTVQRELSEKYDIGIGIDPKQFRFPQHARTNHAKGGIAHVDVPEVCGEAFVGFRVIQVEFVFPIAEKRSLLVNVASLRITQDHIRPMAQKLDTTLQ